MALTERLQQLLQDIRHLHIHLRSETFKKYKRINPFYEDLFEWKDRGTFWMNDAKNITVYNSTTIAGDVSIGENTWIGPFCSIDGTGGLTIGRNCSISAGCHIVSHDTVRWALSGGKCPYEYAPIVIGDCCFIGLHVVIKKGITVGDNCLIAAGAVLTHDIPNNSIAAGVPARIIGKVDIDTDRNVSFNYFK